MKDLNDNLIATKSKQFAIRCVRLYKYLCEQKHEFVMSKQLLRSGTSIGANVWESQKAESTADFVHKLRISLKEANESYYWLMLLQETEFLSFNESNSMLADCDEVIRLLTSIIKSKINSTTSQLVMEDSIEYGMSDFYDEDITN